jgi:hypothetical protein
MIEISSDLGKAAPPLQAFESKTPSTAAIGADCLRNAMYLIRELAHSFAHTLDIREAKDTEIRAISKFLGWLENP